MTKRDDEDAGADGSRRRVTAVRFFADNMLGRLARLLRLWGFDVRYARRDLDDAELVATAGRQRRVLLTADRRLVRRRACERYLLIASHDPWEQLEQVVAELDLELDRSRLFSRCLDCSARLDDAGREEVRGLVPRYVLAAHHRFGRCPGCHRVYWRGSHVEDLERRLQRRRAPIGAAVVLLVAAATASPATLPGDSGRPGDRFPSVARSVQEDEEARFAVDRRHLVGQLRAQGIDDEAVLDAIGSVPRHRLVPEAYRDYAYADTALPIGHGQTISQPFIVALMTELLEVGEGGRVFEVGTGSGYQAAVLAELGCEVYTIEIVPELAETARRRLQELGHESVHVRTGDGYNGWPEEAPFDGIIVTAAPEAVPDPLVEQLRTGGRMVIPLGPRDRTQILTMLTKEPDGSLRRRRVLPVRFVPFVREPEGDRPDGRDH